MKRIILLLLVSTVISAISQAQFTRYIVRFKNKGGTPYTFSNPQAYLSQRAIDRRTRYGIAIDSTDLPVTPAYINQVRAIPNVTLLNVSRWINGITIQTSSAAALTAINALPFVQSTAGIAARDGSGRINTNKFEEEIFALPPSTQRVEGTTADYFNYGTPSYNEIHLHNGEFLHNIGLRGQGMQIAMLDNGFNNYTNLKSFDSMNANGQVLGTWDFVAREQNVSNDGSHGMNCLSTIAANIPGQFVGKAPKASFWLYQTEDNASEYPVEEFNWVCGAERSDSSGADVMSSSLGYFTFDNATLNYTYASMNGNTTISAKGADLAAKKGIMVFLAAGNEGGSAWHYIITPSDADSVVAVGAVT
ncbi:MAG TPA: S8 family serine peptidase, partial [Gammaproteobacteria bacterium]|nr:S8 family serine peptidase [Gammaproteobacteria bacterium]